MVTNSKINLKNSVIICTEERSVITPGGKTKLICVRVIVCTVNVLFTVLIYPTQVFNDF